MPGKFGLMLATTVERPFSDPDWLFEIKWDGVRTLARIEDGALRLTSRNGIDVTKQYPELAELGMGTRGSSPASSRFRQPSSGFRHASSGFWDASSGVWAGGGSVGCVEAA